MKRLKFAILGCGRISYKHVQALYENSEDAELVAVCDPIEDRAQERRRQYEALCQVARAEISTDPNTPPHGQSTAPENTSQELRVYTRLEQLLDDEVDVIVVATESGYHATHALSALESGKHVLIEKPMALSLTDADELIATAEKKRLKIGVCYQNRFNPPILALKKAIDDGRFGRITNGTARILWNRDDDYYKQATWRGTKALDGGTLMNQCIHNIDLLQWMMNSKVVSVKSERATFLHSIEMEDFGVLLIRFESGAIGLVEGSACVYPKNLEETLSIFGETGTVVIGGLAVNEVKTWLFADGHSYEGNADIDIENVYGTGHTPLYKDFIHAVRHDRTPLIDGREGRKSIEIILASYEQLHP
jgi:predicted dehydrogenase